MFRLRVSKILSRRAIASLALGPGIAVLTTGPLGSPGKKGVSEDIWQRKTSGLKAAMGTGRSWVARRGFIEGRRERKRAALAIDRKQGQRSLTRTSRRDPLASLRDIERAGGGRSNWRGG
jgi:hypothetical protein